MPRLFESDTSSRYALVWIAIFAFACIAFAFYYHDAEQLDSGYHYLFARWAWRHPQYFVKVWARPLFTLLYSFPAQLGYPAAKLFTVAVSLATAWQTFRLAQGFKINRPDLAVPVLFLQPVFFLLSSGVLTETLFALIFVIALRLHLKGRLRIAVLVASLLILVRPEGFFIGVLWGLLILFDKGYGKEWWRRLPMTLLLGSGMILWWLAAYLITQDPLWIAHDWPTDWGVNSQANGTGPIWWYVALLPLIVGPLLLAPFFIGLTLLIKRRELNLLTLSFLTVFVLHSLMFSRGWFGSAGYPRYFVCVSPAIALITLSGWQEFIERLRSFFKVGYASVSTTVFVISALVCLFYIDGFRTMRDARAIEEMHVWFQANQRSVSRLICSQAYMRIVFGRDFWEMPRLTNDRNRNLELIRNSPEQTLLFWDEDTGPKLYQMRADDFESAGYVRLKSQAFRFGGYFYTLPWNRFGGPRIQEMHLFYKE